MKWNTGKILTKHAAMIPEKPAVIYEDQIVTYGQLNELTDRTAFFFKQKGLTKGDRIAVDLLNCPQFLACYFAAAKLGLIFVPLNFRLVSSELAFQINRCQCRLLVFHSRFSEEFDSIRETISIEPDKYICVRLSEDEAPIPEWAMDYADMTAGENPGEPVPDEMIDLDDPLMIMFTSGVTGDPKGAVITHGQTYFKCFQIINYTDMRRDDVFQSQAPLCHSAGLAAVSTPALCRGATLLMRSAFDPVKFARDIETYRATIVFGLATMMRFVLESGELERTDLSSVRFAFGGGERTSPDFYRILEEKGLKLLPGFGQTENSAMALMPPDAPQSKSASVGKPNFFTEIRIEDMKGRPLPPGQIGQIVATGANIMKEYWQMPEATKAAIRNGRLYTGDLGYLDEDGFLYIVDRAKDMYRSGAENVYPAEVEGVLLGHPKIEQAAVIGVPDEKWGETGKALIVCKKGETMTEQEVITFLDGKLARFKFPAYILFLDGLPVTVSGKIKKGELKRQFG